MANKEFICTWNEKYLKNFLVKKPNKVLMPLLHINLGLMKNFVKAIVKHHLNSFEFFCKKVPNLSQAMLKEGIFVGPQIGKVFADPEFEKAKIYWNYELGMHLNGFAQIFQKISSHLHIKKMLQSCLWYIKGHHMSLQSIYFIYTLSFFLKILDQLVMSMMKDFIKISKQ